MDRSRIISLLDPEWTRMTGLMRQSLSSCVPLLDKTNCSIMDNMGKMLRPMLSLLMARACGKPDEDSIRFAAASEMLHNATLMHDDVTDGSLERRGRPSVMSLLGSGAAVLIGDFWLSKAVELISSSGNRDDVMKLFSKTLSDLAEGEILQMEKAGTADTSEEDYLRIIYCKTASLFEATCVLGAISAGGCQKYIDAARSYAANAGIAFQIKDDILDYAGNESLGKPVGVDVAEQKITLPLLEALKSSDRVEEVRGMIRNIRNHPDYCSKVRSFVYDNHGIEKAAVRLDGFISRAEEALVPLPASVEKDMLVELVRYNAFRRV